MKDFQSLCRIMERKTRLAEGNALDKRFLRKTLLEILKETPLNRAAVREICRRKIGRSALCRRRGPAAGGDGGVYGPVDGTGGTRRAAVAN